MARTLRGRSPTAHVALLLLLPLAVPATAQDNPARFPGAQDRAQLDAQRAWYLWTAAEAPDQAIAELQSALEAATDDPVRTAALNFYVAVALERRARPEAWQKQLRQLAALGVEPYASWATARAEAPAPQPAQPGTGTHETPHYLRRWAENLDGDEHSPNTQEARAELRKLGVLAVPAILEQLPGYGPLGLRHAMPLLLPHADPRVLQALETRMLEGDASTLYIIAAALADLPPAPRVRLAMIALHSTSLPPRVEAAHCCAAVPEVRDVVLDVLARALRAPSREVRERGISLLVHPDLRALPEVQAHTARLLAEGEAAEVSQLIKAWWFRGRPHQDEELRAFHGRLAPAAQEQFWSLRFQSVPRSLNADETLFAIEAGIDLQEPHNRGAIRNNGLPLLDLAGSFGRADEIVKSVLAANVPSGTVDIVARSLPLAAWNHVGPETLEAAARDSASQDLQQTALMRLANTAPTRALELLLGFRSLANFAAIERELGATLRRTAGRAHLPQMIRYLAAAERELGQELRSHQLHHATLTACADLVARHADDEILDRLLPLYVRFADRNLTWIGSRLLRRIPAPRSTASAGLVLDHLDRLPIVAVDFYLPLLPEQLQPTSAPRVRGAIARSLSRGSDGFDPGSMMQLTTGRSGPSSPFGERYSGTFLASTLQGLLPACGAPGRAALFEQLRDDRLVRRAFGVLRTDHEVDPVRLARAVFGSPGVPQVIPVYLAPGNLDPAGVISNPEIRPLMADRFLAAELGTTAALDLAGFLRALPEEERWALCESTLDGLRSKLRIDEDQVALARAALDALADTQDPSLCPTMARGLQVRSVTVKRHAIECLKSSLSTQAAPFLFDALTDPDDSVRHAAEEALGVIRASLITRESWREWIEQVAPRKDG